MKGRLTQKGLAAMRAGPDMSGWQAAAQYSQAPSDTLFEQNLGFMTPQRIPRSEMPNQARAIQEIIAAEIAAHEAQVAAEKLREIGALVAYPAAAEIARLRKAKVATLKALAIEGIRRPAIDRAPGEVAA